MIKPLIMLCDELITNPVPPPSTTAVHDDALPALLPFRALAELGTDDIWVGSAMMTPPIVDVATWAFVERPVRDDELKTNPESPGFDTLL